jgi:site-specific recombinase XerC
MRDPANLPALLQSFFTTRLMTQRKASPHTVASYRDTFRLLLQFAQKRLRKAPSQLGLGDLDHSSLNNYTMIVSSILYFHRNTTGAALTSSKY